MLFLLSPAKSLDYETPIGARPHTDLLFTSDAYELIKTLRTQSQRQISALMDISDTLAALNVARYAAWSRKPPPDAARQAVLAFNGDVYDGLDAYSLDAHALEWAQEHIAILSGLYGVLRPLDRMQPYRLEMGTRLATGRGANLYQFWGARIADYLNQRLRADATPVVVNLASQEYFKSVDLSTLKARVVECVFEEWRGDRYKIISFSAKRARGLMARYAADSRIATPQGLQSFNADGYAFDAAASRPERLVFRRTPPPA